MRKSLLLGFALLVLVLSGCGGSTTINTSPLTDDQKKQIAEEDKRIADEESGRTAGKSKKGKRP